MTCIVVGSGPSGANAALTLLRRGKQVELWDVGREEPGFPLPDADFHALKQSLADPQGYFLGPAFEALMTPGAGELLRYPPARSFLLQPDDPLWPFADGEFRPFASYTRGGLGVGWGANAVSFDDDDLRDWPIAVADLAEAYAEAGRRMPIAGAQDRLSSVFTHTPVSQPPLRLSRHDARLLAKFQRRAARVEGQCHFSLGHARVAVVTDPAHASACRYCGRCLWGCPHGSLYDPARTTLAECRRYPNFTYRPERLVLNLEASEGAVRGIRYLSTQTRSAHSEPCAAVFLAAGALQSGGIFLRTLQRDASLASRPQRTQSVMDTTVVKMPYIQLGSVGTVETGGDFQFNRLIAAHRKPRAAGWPSHCHGEVLSLNTLLYHPLIESIPLGSRFGMRMFARLRAALGVVTYFFPDRQMPGNGISLMPDPASPSGDRLVVHYGENGDKEALIQDTARDTRRALRMLGCVPWLPMRSPSGGGIHYAGTVPMGEGPLCSDPTGRTNAYRNLYVCDGAAFPSLPSKSITLNLVAHAIRVATLAEP